MSDRIFCNTFQQRKKGRELDASDRIFCNAFQQRKKERELDVSDRIFFVTLFSKGKTECVGSYFL